MALETILSYNSSKAIAEYRAMLTMAYNALSVMSITYQVFIRFLSYCLGMCCANIYAG